MWYFVVTGITFFVLCVAMFAYMEKHKPIENADEKTVMTVAILLTFLSLIALSLLWPISIIAYAASLFYTLFFKKVTQWVYIL